ncbi:MAG: asparagine synthase-related protein, partial [Acidobacteriota bacterium]
SRTRPNNPIIRGIGMEENSARTITSRNGVYTESRTLPVGLVFASDLPLLLRLPFIPRDLNERMVLTTLGRDPQRPASDSYYRAIDLLPAGHVLYYRPNGIAIRRWSQPQLSEIRRPDAEDRLRAELTRAVEERMRGGERIAVHLSGGLDSSAIACIAARHLRPEGRRLLAFSSVLPSGWSGPETDERIHIEAVLAQEDNIDIHWVDLPVEHSPFAGCQQGFELLGQPAYTNVSHIEQQFGLLGREFGVDVVLSGFGGDFFASWRGQGVLQALLRERRWRQTASEFLAMHRQGLGTWQQLIRRHLLAPLRAWLLSQKPQLRSELQRLAFRHPREQMRFVAEPGRVETVLNAEVQFFDRGFGQSIRFPLLDRRIVEFMQSVPVDELQRHGETRSLFRRAMKGILPDSVRLRQDKGPAFDPAIAARIAASREKLEDWATRTAEAPWWRYIDRSLFLRELAAVRPGKRDDWRSGLFETVLMGGILAQFMEWAIEHGDRTA